MVPTSLPNHFYYDDYMFSSPCVVVTPTHFLLHIYRELRCFRVLKTTPACFLDLGLHTDANHAAADASAGIAGGLAQLVAADSQVVHVGVHHQRAADNVVRAAQLDLLVDQLHLADAVGARLNVAQVADVARLRRGTAVRLALRIEMRSGGNAAVGVVAKLVHVEAV